MRYIYVNLIFSFFLISCADVNKNENTPNLPNIIYILADDLGYGDLSSYGQNLFTTPHIDALAKSGMMFTQHYSGNTVCAPSRATLMTGLHAGHVAVRGNKEIRPEGQSPLKAAEETIPEILKTKGYVTGAFGKWGLGFPGSEGDPTNQGFDHFFGYNCQRFAHNYYPRHLWDNTSKVQIPENEGLKKGRYAPELIQNKTLEFIEANKSKPFFLFVPHVIPHAELAAPEELMDKYRGKYLPEIEYKTNPDGLNYREGDYDTQIESHAAFVAMIDLLDQHVGQIVSKVTELGLLENTIIIFTSDNGPHKEGGADPEFFNSNGPLKGFKRDLTEGGIRVPMIASWPSRIKPNTKTDHISSFQDVKATMAEIAGGINRKKDDGISFLPTLLGQEDQKKHEYLYWEFGEGGEKIAVRYGKWKAVKNGIKFNPNVEFQLFDLESSLAEEEDLAMDFPEVLSKIKRFAKSAHVKNDDFLLHIDKTE